MTLTLATATKEAVMSVDWQEFEEERILGSLAVLDQADKTPGTERLRRELAEAEVIEYVLAEDED